MKLNESNYVDLAEKAILELTKNRDKRGNIVIVSTSQIRNLLAMTADIYNDILDITSEQLPKEIISRISYLKVRFIYEAGRTQTVRSLVEKAEIIEHLEEIKGSKSQYILFSRYMEALVAYRKFYGGKE